MADNIAKFAAVLENLMLVSSENLMFFGLFLMIGLPSLLYSLLLFLTITLSYLQSPIWDLPSLDSPLGLGKAGNGEG